MSREYQQIHITAEFDLPSARGAGNGNCCLVASSAGDCHIVKLEKL